MNHPIYCALYRPLLWLYPPAHRRGFGKEMVQHLDDLLSHGAAQYDGLIRIELFLLALLELPKSILSEWWAVMRGKEPLRDTKTLTERIYAVPARPSLWSSLACALISVAIHVYSVVYFLGPTNILVWIPILMGTRILWLSIAVFRYSRRISVTLQTLFYGLFLFAIAFYFSVNTSAWALSLLLFTAFIFVIHNYIDYLYSAPLSVCRFALHELTAGEQKSRYSAVRRQRLRIMQWGVGLLVLIIFANGWAAFIDRRKPLDYAAYVTDHFGKTEESALFRHMDDYNALSTPNICGYGSVKTCSVKSFSAQAKGTVPIDDELSRASKIEVQKARSILQKMSQEPSGAFDAQSLDTIDPSKLITYPIPDNTYTLFEIMRFAVRDEHRSGADAQAFDDLYLSLRVANRLFSAKGITLIERLALRRQLTDLLIMSADIGSDLTPPQRRQILDEIATIPNVREVLIGGWKMENTVFFTILNDPAKYPLPDSLLDRLVYGIPYKLPYLYQPRTTTHFALRQFDKMVLVAKASCDADYLPDMHDNMGDGQAVSFLDLLLPNSFGKITLSWRITVGAEVGNSIRRDSCTTEDAIRKAQGALLQY